MKACKLKVKTWKTIREKTPDGVRANSEVISLLTLSLDIPGTSLVEA